MPVRKIITSIILLEILGMASAANAQGTATITVQETTTASESKTLGDRLDDFHNMLFGNPATDKKGNRETPANKESTQSGSRVPRSTSGKYAPYQYSENTVEDKNDTIPKSSGGSQQKTPDSYSNRPVRVYKSSVSESSQSLPVAPAKQAQVLKAYNNTELNSESSDGVAPTTKPLYER
jgi:hypothetical protein